MSLTVGVTIRGLSEIRKAEAEKCLEQLAQKHGYKFSFGVSKAYEDVRAGLETLSKSWETHFFAFIHAPATEPEPLMGEVFEEEGPDSWPPKFLKLIEEVGSSLAKNFPPPTFFFAVYWDKSDRVRRESGTIGDLLIRLKSPYQWTHEMYVPEDDSYWCDDYVPLLFDITSQ